MASAAVPISPAYSSPAIIRGFFSIADVREERGQVAIIYLAPRMLPTAGVQDFATTTGTAVNYDANVLSGIGYDRRDNLAYFSGDLDEIGVWTSTLSQNDFVSLYNAGTGYAYPFGSSTLATSTYTAQTYKYDALGNFTTKGANKYTYAQTGYANPDAPTQIANGVSTTTYGYDNNGNLTSAGTSTFSWDYNNRMTQAVTQGSTTTYAYDYAGNRVSQTVGSTTTIYPNKYYSITSTTNGATTYSTTTQYIYNGDQLVAELDQTYTNGATTSVQKLRYIHPDHLGSTNIATDDVGNVVQTVDYYPYGEIRLNQRTGMYNEQHKYIGQYADSTGLDYLNARYLNSQQGQFLSEDPVFLGDPSQQTLADPESLNSYSYANDNPINKSDPLGLWAIRYGVSGTIPGWGLTGEMGIQTDFQGLEFYYGAGLAGGGGVTIGPAFTTADLSHEYSITTSAFAQGGAGLSVEVSKGMTYFPYSKRKPEPSQEATVGFPSVELAGGVMSEVSGPISLPKLGGQPPINYSLPRPQFVGAPNSQISQANSYRGSSSGTVGGTTSVSQTLSSLQSALQQLSVVLSTYKGTASH